MSNEQDVFSFDLNESLYFEKGQEVSQMWGISLEPEISIQTFNEYVSIRGVIELSGEYEKKQTNSGDEEQSLDFNVDQTRRYFEQVKDEESGFTTFSHRFPVEVSVPAYRVDDMNDIKVSVASFDYEIIDDSQLRLISTIEIHGISNETVLPAELNERIEDVKDVQEMEMLEEDFQFELKEELFEDSKRNEVEKEIEPEIKEQEAGENEEEVIDKDRWKYKQTQSLEEFFKEDNLDKEEETIATKDEEDVSSDIDTQEEPEDEEVPERESNYLAELFNRDEFKDEIKYEQMRICIVQEKDTLESISERYQIPKLQLLKLNKLADDDLTKGQLLTIPAKRKSQ